MGSYPCERLPKELDADKFKLQFVSGPEEERRELLKKLVVYAKVLTDLGGLNLVEPYRRAAEKIGKAGLIPSLSIEETTGIPSDRLESATQEVQRIIDVDKLVEQLRSKL